MKPVLVRRFRRRSTPSKSEGTFFKKESQESFFGGAEHESFFQPAAATPAVAQPVQRKCAECEKEDKQLQREPEKKEEDKEIQRAEDKKEEDKVMRVEDKKEEEKVQKAEDDKKEEEQVQRAEDKKEEEKVMRAEDKTIQKKQVNGTTPGSANTANYVSTLSGKGQPLPVAANYFFSSRMGYDFSDVKIHNDKSAAESARNINAKAYTIGNNVVFNEGKYNTTSGEGKNLLAHELTHVIQQDKNADRKIQRKTPAGFDITGVYGESPGFPNTIFYEMGSAAIPSSEAYKLSGIATTFTGKNVTLTGTASEEGDAALNASIVNGRIAGVDRMLGSLRHTGMRSRNPLPTVSRGNIDYRKVRNVTVTETPGVIPPGGVAPSTAPSCEVTPANPTPEVISCGTSFNTVFPLAMSWVITAFSRIAAGDPAALAQAAILFPGIPIGDIQTHLGNLIQQMGRLPAQHRCHNECDSDCGSGAYNTGTGSSSMMTLCTQFVNSTDVNDNAFTLVHESLHATPGLAAEDIAYHTTRLIETLTGAQAVRNTDSYSLLIMRLAGVSPIASPAADDLSSLSAPEQAHARTVMSLLEQWLLSADRSFANIYGGMDKNIGSATGWTAPDTEYAAFATHDLATTLGLTDPGADPYPTAPITEDKVKMAGVWDRFNQLLIAVYMTNIKVNKIGAGPDKWARALGPSVDVGAAFFAMTVEDAIKHLLRLLIASQGRVPGSLVNSYIEAINIVRKHLGTGP
jgi:hypothetical protein